MKTMPHSLVALKVNRYENNATLFSCSKGESVWKQWSWLSNRLIWYAFDTLHVCQFKFDLTRDNLCSHNKALLLEIINENVFNIGIEGNEYLCSSYSFNILQWSDVFLIKLPVSQIKGMNGVKDLFSPGVWVTNREQPIG